MDELVERKAPLSEMIELVGLDKLVVFTSSISQSPVQH